MHKCHSSHIKILNSLPSRPGKDSVFVGFVQADCAPFIIPPISQQDRPTGAFVLESATSQLLFTWDIEGELVDWVFCSCVVVSLRTTGRHFGTILKAKLVGCISYCISPLPKLFRGCVFGILFLTSEHIQEEVLVSYFVFTKSFPLPTWHLSD